MPTPIGRGLAGVLGPTRGGVANGGNSPPLLVLWGAPPHPPPWGLRPPGPPFAHPRGPRVCQRFGPHSWLGLLMRATLPLLYSGGTSPRPPCQGGKAPWTPVTHPRGLRVCRRFVSHSWRIGKWRQLFPSFCSGGTSPRPPARGQSPLDPRYPPSWAEGLPAFRVPLVADWQMGGNFSPLFVLGAHPPDPLPGGKAPWIPVTHPRGLRVCQRFGSHSWRGC